MGQVWGIVLVGVCKGIFVYFIPLRKTKTLAPYALCSVCHSPSVSDLGPPEVRLSDPRPEMGKKLSFLTRKYLVMDIRILTL